MREMKDSGYDWIGKVNVAVNLVPLKYLLSEEKAPIKVGPFGSQLSGSDFLDDESDYWVYNQRVVIDDNYENGDAFITKEKYDAMIGFHVTAGDILITTRGTIGKISRVPREHKNGILHPCIIRFRINENKIRYDLLSLIFNESDFIVRQINYKSNATTIEVIYSETLKNLILPIWPMGLQERIAKYLCEKCNQIDALTADIHSQIDTLEQYKRSVITEAVTKGLDPDAEMKDSGVEWIGKIPNSWKIARLKYVLDEPMKYGATESGVDYDDDLFRYIRITDITAEGTLKEQGKLSLTYEQANGYILRDNAILFARSGTVGKSFIYRSSYGKAAFAGYLISAYANVAKVFPEWILYFTYCSAYWEWINHIFTQATIQNIGADKYSNMPIPVAPLHEQRIIINSLNAKCAEIDSAIAEKRQQLEILNKYKQSLIFEYVTGKKEVPAS